MSSKFTKQQKKFILNNYEKFKNNTILATELINEFNLDNSYKFIDSLRKRISNLLHSEGIIRQNTLESTKEFKEAKARKLNNSKYYIITYEQNETPIHKEFWRNILAYKEFLNAEISVILGRYKNPTSVFSDKNHENWSNITRPYHDANRHDIHKYLTVLADVKISPTRKYPLTGLNGLAVGKSIIVGHTKLHMTSEPTLDGHPKRMMFTTGAITYPNYTDSGIGKISEGNHKFGFVIVEIKDKEIFYIRQVEANNDGSFVDLFFEVSNGNVRSVDKALGLVCGDTHYGVLDPKIDKKNDEIVNILDIRDVVLHDVIDGESVNNHILKNPIEQFNRYKNNRYLIEKELEDTTDWLKSKLYNGYRNIIIPQANHNNRFDRALLGDWRKDIPNSLFYLKYTSAVLEGKASKGVFAYFVENKIDTGVTFLTHTDSYIIGKYEVSQHGDWGANGSKGSPRSFRNLEIPMITAHSHTPFRADDTLYVGTNTFLKIGYNEKGASSWQQANVLINKDGTAQHIIFVRGEYTTLYEKYYSIK